MINLRSALKRILPSTGKRQLERVLLGYHSFAPSFSSAGEDMILRHLLGSDKRDGFYVDVGAFHPIHASNTYFFYLNGWTGLNIDARPGSMRLFNKIRPNDINIETGVSDVDGQLTYYFIAEDSSMNSFSKPFLEEIGMLKHVQREIPVPVSRLAEVLDRHLPQGQTIDFMNVDVEGLDYNVLVSNDWTRYRPRVVVVEDAHQTTGEPRIASLLKERGYEPCIKNVILPNKVDEFFFIDKMQFSEWRS